jgi:murein DD-endopeptidase MepM/ murein hydrolase activator NlpD
MRSLVACLACLTFVASGCTAGDGPTTGRGGTSGSGDGGMSATGGTGGTSAKGGNGAGGSVAGAGGSVAGASGSVAGIGGSVAGAGGSVAGAGGSVAGAGGSAGSGRGGGAAGAAGGRGGGTARGGAGGGTGGAVVGLSWPIDCIPGQTCVNLGYPDVDKDGKAFNCAEPGYSGHEGTDIGITFAAMDAGTAVRAAADGVVLFAFDGKYDRCPDATQPDCQAPAGYVAGATTGTTVCTPLGPYCGTGTGSCFWCFAGGNVIVIRHTGVDRVFATRYDHLRRNSVLVRPGDTVRRGQKIAEAGSAGNSTGPHLHFEVWGTGFYELTEPWAGTCGPNRGPSLWAREPPWSN